MKHFERVYMRTLRHIYDTERQLAASLRPIAERADDARLADALNAIERQSDKQMRRIEAIFSALYLEPKAEASWATTALLREAWDACDGGHAGGTQGCAAALLAIKRYEITLYEALLRWSEQCHLDEAIPDIRRSIAEELLQASVLSELAFVEAAGGPALTHADQSALH